MLRRVAIVAMLVSLTLPLVVVGEASASPVFRHRIAPIQFPTPPPLGYYYTVAKSCQNDPNDYYHNQAFYHACQQAKEIITDAANPCDELGLFGIILTGIATVAGGPWSWATFAVVSGMTVGCFKG
jgi:hypothetical protein